MFKTDRNTKPSVLALGAATAVLAALQVAPPSLSLSVAQIAVTGALLVWFVGFALKRA